MSIFRKVDDDDQRLISKLDSRLYDAERRVEECSADVAVAIGEAKKIPPLRDQFAMAAVTGLLTSEALITRHPRTDYSESIVKKAYRIADLMMLERSSGRSA